MAGPTPEDQPSPDQLSAVERESRIEQLLVSGLDEYFAGRHDHAINVWTRVLFLDRANDRARAYIDRARRAQAERQRETEALVHEGLQAFDAGDVEVARRLLTSALEHGAAHEQALPVLHRIGLLAAPATAAPSPRRWRRAPQAAATGRRRSWGWLVVPMLLATAAAAAWIVLVAPASGGAAAPSSIESAATPLPVPGAAEAYLARARALFAAGKLPDALVALDRVPVGDAAYAAAQSLRARVQRELLHAADLGADRTEGTPP